MVKVALTHKTKDRERIANLRRPSPSNKQRRVTLQGKDPIAEVFVEAPIKIAQKYVCSGGH
jgi:hypothetical protein